MRVDGAVIVDFFLVICQYSGPLQIIPWLQSDGGDVQDKDSIFATSEAVQLSI